MPTLSRRKLYTPQHAALYVGAPSAPTGALWDGATATSGITVSGGGSVVTCSGAGGATQARSTTHKSSGKWYVKVAFTNDAGGSNAGIGLAGTGFTLGSIYLGGSSSPADTTCAFKNGQIYNNNGAFGTWYTIGPFTTGRFLEMAVDLTVSPIRSYYQLTGSPQTWNNSGGDPVAGTGGLGMDATVTDVYFACDFETGETGSAFTIVSGTPPSGYTAWT